MFNYQMQVIRTHVFQPVLQTGSESLKKSIRFARMCLEVNLRNNPQSQSHYVRNSILKNHLLNDLLEQNGFHSFRSLVNNGLITLI